MDDRRIRELRLRLGLSQERFARLLGVSQQTVRRWEAGLSRPLPIIGVRLEELQKEAHGSSPRSASLMAVDGGKRSGETIEPGMFSLFKGLGGFLNVIAKMAENGTEGFSRFGEAEIPGTKVRGVYGVSVKVGLGGQPVIEQFGNIRTTDRGVEVAEVREPLVDIFEEGERLVIVAELPGVEPGDIHIELKGDVLTLMAEGKYRKYSKEVLLPSSVDATTMKSSYLNGILTIELAR
ncbi:MAG: helix-turn-helix domain-containing protein [Dehalococcoidales bacterium]|nr:helix-turn-helix domain-containing protein [Dehalococcoidales bacterium]